MSLPLPSEVSEHALTFLPPRSLAAFAQTSRAARALIYATPDDFLWRHIFLAHWDDPRRALNPLSDVYADVLAPDAYDWRAELQARVRAERDPNPLILCTALDEALPVQAEWFAEPSKNTRWVRAVLKRQRWILLNDDTRLIMHEGEWESCVRRLRSVLALEFELDDLRRLKEKTLVDWQPPMADEVDENEQHGSPSPLVFSGAQQTMSLTPYPNYPSVSLPRSAEDTGLTHGLSHKNYSADPQLGYLEVTTNLGQVYRRLDIEKRYAKVSTPLSRLLPSQRLSSASSQRPKSRTWTR